MAIYICMLNVICINLIVYSAVEHYYLSYIFRSSKRDRSICFNLSYSLYLHFDWYLGCYFLLLIILYNKCSECSINIGSENNKHIYSHPIQNIVTYPSNIRYSAHKRKSVKMTFSRKVVWRLTGAVWRQWRCLYVGKFSCEIFVTGNLSSCK